MSSAVWSPNNSARNSSQQVFVDNRGGAGGTIGTEACSVSAPDGYTLCIISIAHAVNPWLHKLSYDPIKSFIPVTILATGPNVLVVNKDAPFKSVKDLIARRQGGARTTQLCERRRRQLPAPRR